MTMKIRVANEDATRVAAVKAITLKLDVNFKPTGEEVIGDKVTEIAPGQVADFYIHSGLAIRVDEKQ